MKNIIISSLFFICSILSANTFAAEASGVHLPEGVNLVIYRPADRSAINYRVSVDGKHLGKLKRNSSMQLRLEPGEHVITSSDPKRTRLVTTVNAEGVTYIRNHIDRKNRLSLTVSEPDKTVLHTLSSNSTASRNQLIN